MMTGLVYKLTSPSGKIYVGQTINLYKRFNRYKNKLCKHQIKLYNSIVKYGFEAHQLEILCADIAIEELDHRENHYIALYNCVDKGLNCANFASVPMRGKMHSEETKNKMRLKATGKKHTVETLMKLADAKRGKPGNNTGKSMSLETKNKIRATRALRGYKCKLQGNGI